jgi:hypothetical protein
MAVQWFFRTLLFVGLWDVSCLLMSHEPMFCDTVGYFSNIWWPLMWIATFLTFRLTVAKCYGNGSSRNLRLRVVFLSHQCNRISCSNDLTTKRTLKRVSVVVYARSIGSRWDGLFESTADFMDTGNCGYGMLIFVRLPASQVFALPEFTGEQENLA